MSGPRWEIPDRPKVKPPQPLQEPYHMNPAPVLQKKIPQRKDDNTALLYGGFAVGLLIIIGASVGLYFLLKKEKDTTSPKIETIDLFTVCTCGLIEDSEAQELNTKDGNSFQKLFESTNYKCNIPNHEDLSYTILEAIKHYHKPIAEYLNKKQQRRRLEDEVEFKAEQVSVKITKFKIQEGNLIVKTVKYDGLLIDEKRIEEAQRIAEEQHPRPDPASGGGQPGGPPGGGQPPADPGSALKIMMKSDYEPLFSGSQWTAFERLLDDASEDQLRKLADSFKKKKRVQDTMEFFLEQDPILPIPIHWLRFSQKMNKAKVIFKPETVGDIGNLDTLISDIGHDIDRILDDDLQKRMIFSMSEWNSKFQFLTRSFIARELKNKDCCLKNVIGDLNNARVALLLIYASKGTQEAFWKSKTPQNVLKDMDTKYLKPTDSFKGTVMSERIEQIIKEHITEESKTEKEKERSERIEQIIKEHITEDNRTQCTEN